MKEYFLICYRRSRIFVKKTISYIKANDIMYYVYKYGYMFLVIHAINTLIGYVYIESSDCNTQPLVDSGYIFIVSILIMLTVTWYTRKILKSERLEYMFTTHGKEAIMQYDILFNIASKINHEIRSPATVLYSYVTDIVEEAKVLELNCSKGAIKKYSEELIKTSDMAVEALDQIFNTVSALSDYKQIKYSNGDKNMYMLIDVAAEMLSKTAFLRFQDISVIIDPELKKYKIYHDNGMTNSFFLSTIINHIKNSVEASATEIKIELLTKTDKHLKIGVIDDGVGVPAIVKDHVFELDFSTKANQKNKDRGSGLYINKTLMSCVYDGDVELIRSIPNEETIFSIKLRYKAFNLNK